MKIGFSSTCAWNLSPTRSIAHARELGIYSFELWFDHYVFHDESVGKIRKALRENEIVATVHASSWDINITSTSKPVREFSIEQVKKSIDLAEAIAAPLITVHPGKKSYFRARRDEIAKAQQEAFHTLFCYSEGKDVMICVENIEDTGRDVMVTEADFIDFFSKIDDDLFITLDVAHLGDLQRIEMFYSKLRERIRHIHISDLNQVELHVPMGDGILQTEAVLSLLKDTYRGIFSLEFYQDDPSGNEVFNSVEYLKALGDKLDYP